MSDLQTLDIPYPGYDGTQPCASMNPELFFPAATTTPVSPVVKAACARCPFIRECLGYALANLVEGFWGGTTTEERTRLRVAHGIQGRPLTFKAGPPSLVQRIAELDRAGMDRVEIATELGITPHSVDHHLKHDGRARP